MRRKSTARIARGFHQGAEIPANHHISKRAVKMRTVDALQSAVDNSWQDRPQESPANRRINEGAGDAVGISRGTFGKASVIAFSAVQSHRLDVLGAASNALVAEEHTLDDPEYLTEWTSPQYDFYLHRAHAEQTSGTDRGLNLLLPLPSWFLSAAPKGESCGGKNR